MRFLRLWASGKPDGRMPGLPSNRDPQYIPPKGDPVDDNGLTRDQRRIWREFMNG
jgi:hypothetical protein